MPRSRQPNQERTNETHNHKDYKHKTQNSSYEAHDHINRHPADGTAELALRWNFGLLLRGRCGDYITLKKLNHNKGT